MGFTHLHAHTEYSLLDGMARIKEVVAKCKELGMDSLAITDHGSMYGVIEFYNECKKQGIKPIIGCEFYITDDLSGKDRNKTSHLILLAKDNEGYKNLLRLCSIGFLDGFYYKPRIDYDTLSAHAKGIVCLSACLAGDLPKLVYKEDYDGAKEYIAKMKKIFGKDFYVELQDHGIPREKAVSARLEKIAKETNTPMVITNDVHYINREDAQAQDILICIQTNAFVSDTDRMRMDTDQMYLKSEEEMAQLFPHLPEAMENTQKIANECNVEIDFDTLHLPFFPVPKGKDPYEYLVEQTRNGMDRLGLSGKETYEKRLLYELETIKSMGFVDYFLIVWDYVRFAKENRISVGPGRGSAAGSLCSYVLNITTVDPIEYNLIFERFLNPERISMPDIDIDFSTDRRQEVIDYVVDKYGKDRVAQIITFNTMAAKACIKNVARVMQYPFSEANKISKMIPNELGITISRALEVSKELRDVYEGNSEVKQIIDLSLKLEGIPSHAGTHAAGVVISKSPLTDFIPLQKNDDVVTTQFPMGIVEQLGLLKMDFLGLRNLNVIQNTVDIIKHSRKIDLDMDAIPYDDEKVYKMISRGDTDGVFQLESRGMQAFLKELRPDCFEDVIAGISLFRPGPMDQIPTYVKCKAHPEFVSYIHPKLEPILNMTYGCMVYQEQVMQIVRDLAGYSFGRSDLVRRAMAKKKQDVMDKERKVFIHGDEKEGIIGAVKNGVDEKSANKIFDQMTDFAQYAFNRSHAAAYGIIAYETAYLKCHYPAEFFAATINSYGGDNDKVARYIARCGEIGIKTVKPDINISRCEFAVEKGDIVFGLLAIKNVGSAAARAVVDERDKNGKFKDFYDFCRRCASLINKRMVESMIYAGCFDSFGHNRSSLLGCYETLLSHVSSSGQANGQMSLFDMGENGMSFKIDERPELDSTTLLFEEKARTGIYLSGHPLVRFENELKRFDVNIAEINDGEIEDGKTVCLAGMIVDKRNHTTKSNEIMAFLELEDLTGRISVIAFPRVLVQFSPMTGVGNFVVVKGRISAEVVTGEEGEERERFSIILESMEPLKNAKTLQIKLWEMNSEFFSSIRKGDDSVEIFLNEDGKWKKSVRSGVLVDDVLENKAKKLFGEENIRVV